jgi:osmotically-inducible protein OsmY
MTWNCVARGGWWHDPRLIIRRQEIINTKEHMKTKSIKVLSITFFSALALLATTGCNKDNQTPVVDSTTTVKAPTERTVGEAVDDTTVTARVKKALGENAEYKFDDVKVTTMKGTAQLSGFVNTKAQKTAAGDIAAKVPNVKEVANNITVKE